MQFIIESSHKPFMAKQRVDLTLSDHQMFQVVFADVSSWKDCKH